jgi:MFS family permease
MSPVPSARYGPLLFVGASLALTQIGFYLTAAALPLYLRDLGAAQGRIGLEVGLGSLAALIATIALGPAINRRGAQLFLRAGAILYLAASLGMLLAAQEGAVAAFRTVQGVGNAFMGPSAFVLAAGLVPRRPGTAIGLLGALNTVALAIGPPVGLALYSGHGASALFWPAAGMAALGLAVALLLPARESPAPAAPGLGFDRAWLPPLLANGLAVMYFGGIVAYLPLVLRHAHGPNAGIFFTADAVGVLLLRVPTGMLADRSGSLLPKVAGVALTLPGIAVLALPPSIPVLVVSGAFTGAGAGLFITGVLADLARLSTEANRGTAMSMGTGSFSASIFAGSTISGLLIGAGFNAILVFGFLTTVAALPFAWRRVTPLDVSR